MKLFPFCVILYTEKEGKKNHIEIHKVMVAALDLENLDLGVEDHGSAHSYEART